jgi:hypothetical protein
MAVRRSKTVGYFGSFLGLLGFIITLNLTHNYSPWLRIAAGLVIIVITALFVVYHLGNNETPEDFFRRVKGEQKIRK